MRVKIKHKTDSSHEIIMTHYPPVDDKDFSIDEIKDTIKEKFGDNYYIDNIKMIMSYDIITVKEKMWLGLCDQYIDGDVIDINITKYDGKIEPIKECIKERLLAFTKSLIQKHGYFYGYKFTSELCDGEVWIEQNKEGN